LIVFFIPWRYKPINILTPRPMNATSSFGAAIGALLAVTNPLFAQTDPGKPVPDKPDQSGWTRLFDGKTLSGWTTFDPGGWTVQPEGVVMGKGPRSHLFSPNTYTNLEFKADVRLKSRSNSGMYFRAQKGPGWPKGYEAQVCNSCPDPQKTGSLYGMKRVTEQLVLDDTWWRQHIIAIGNRIIIKVNDKIVADHVDEQNTHMTGHLAFQQHDPQSQVEYRNVMAKRLPADEKAAWAEARKDVPGLSPDPKN
jgi:hypothetical protein